MFIVQVVTFLGEIQFCNFGLAIIVQLGIIQTRGMSSGDYLWVIKNKIEIRFMLRNRCSC